MKISSLLSVAIVLLAFTCGNAQNNDCCNAKVICGSPVIYANPSGIGNNDFYFPGNSHGCLDTLEKNSVWFYFKMNKNTPPESFLGFIIDPEGGVAEDFDFALYGPNAKCGTLGEPIRCSFAEKFCKFCPKTGMWNKSLDYSEDKLGDGFVKGIKVNAGEGYYLLVQNYTGSNNGFKLHFTDKASNYIECDAQLPCCLNIETSPDITVCAGAAPFELNTKLIEGTPKSFLWEGTGKGTSFLNNTKDSNPIVTIPVSFEGTIIYTVKVYDGICQTTAMVKVTVNPKPKIFIDSIGPICNNMPQIQLKGIPQNGIWSGIANADGKINPAALSPGKHQVTLYFKNSFECSSEHSSEIEILEVTQPEIANIDTLCINNAPLLLNAKPTGGKWTGDIKESGQFITQTKPGKYKAFYAYKNNFGCLSHDSIDINILELPPVLISDPGMLCSSELNFKMTALPYGGTWKGIADPNGMIHPQQLGLGKNMAYYQFSNEHGCMNMDSIEIKLIPPPIAEIVDHIKVCNSTDSGKKTTLNFNEFVLSGDKTGVWKEVNASNCSGNFPVMDFKKVKPGTYHFTYKLTSQSLVCSDFIDTIAIKVEDCECPGLELITPVLACNSEKNLKLEEFKITKEPGNWSIINTPGSANPAYISGSNLNIEGKDPGNYLLNFKLSQKPIEGCQESADLELTLNAIPKISLPAIVEVCNDHNSNYPVTLDLYSFINGKDKSGTWVDKNNSGATGNFNELDFSNVKEGNYKFEYTTSDAEAPCLNLSYSLNVHVNDCNCPDLSLVPKIKLCQDLQNFDLSELLINNLSGSWSISSSPIGNKPALITNNLITFDNADTGIYNIQFIPATSVPLGCAPFATTLLNITKSSYAGKALSELKLCEGEASSIKLSDRLIDEDANGIWELKSSSLDPGSAYNSKASILNTQILSPGVYEFEYLVKGESPCSDDTREISILIESNPSIDAGKDQTLDCQIVEAQLGQDINLPAGYLISWSGPSLSNSTLAQPIVKSPGLYFAKFIKQGSSCSVSDSVYVFPNGASINRIDVNVQEVSCRDALNGKIEITNIDGGTGNFEYQLDNNNQAFEPSFELLKSGMHLLKLTDSKGCNYDTLINIGTGNGISLDLGPDLFVNQYDNFTIAPALNVPPSEISSMLWSPYACDNCFQLNEKANVTTQYVVTAFDKYGCKGSDEINVFVKKTRNVFIPNVFSPNGDGINDVFFINTGEGIEEIVELQIFDRWGAQLFSKTHFQPNDPSAGWDGKARQQTLNTEIFVYWTLIKFSDGETVLYKGDLTLQK